MHVRCAISQCRHDVFDSEMLSGPGSSSSLMLGPRNDPIAADVLGMGDSRRLAALAEAEREEAMLVQAYLSDLEHTQRSQRDARSTPPFVYYVDPAPNARQSRNWRWGWPRLGRLGSISNGGSGSSGGAASRGRADPFPAAQREDPFPATSPQRASSSGSNLRASLGGSWSSQRSPRRSQSLGTGSQRRAGARMSNTAATPSAVSIDVASPTSSRVVEIS